MSCLSTVLWSLRHVMTTSQMRDFRFTEVKVFPHFHTTARWQIWDLNLGRPVHKAHVPNGFASLSSQTVFVSPKEALFRVSVIKQGSRVGRRSALPLFGGTAFAGVVRGWGFLCLGRRGTSSGTGSRYAAACTVAGHGGSSCVSPEAQGGDFRRD